MPTTVTKTVKSSGGDYTSLSAWEAGEQGNLVTADEIRQAECYAMNDTTAVVLDGWTMDATRYARVFCATGEGHDGKLNTSKYRITLSASGNALQLAASANYARIEGLQAIVTGNGGDTCGFMVAGSFSGGRVRFEKCIAAVTNTGGSSGPFGFRTVDGNAAVTVDYINCIAQDCYGVDFPTSQFGGGFYLTYADQTNYYNCTAYKCSMGFAVVATYGCDVYNCLGAASRATTPSDFVGTLTNGSNNASSDATALGTSPRTNQTFTFVDETGTFDLHLDSADAGAKDFGLTDPSSGLYSDDIDGVARSGSWDIGADEAAASGTTAVIPSRRTLARLNPERITPQPSRGPVRRAAAAGPQAGGVPVRRLAQTTHHSPLTTHPGQRPRKQPAPNQVAGLLVPRRGSLTSDLQPHTSHLTLPARAALLAPPAAAVAGAVPERRHSAVADDPPQIAIDW